MLNSVIRSKIFSEFTPEEQQEWFSIKEKAVSQHIDSLYYSIFIKDDEVNPTNENLINFLMHLETLKAQIIQSPESDIKFFDLTVKRSGAAISHGLYAHHFELFECYDVYISPYIPNLGTPRIQVQLRTHSLVVNGLYGSIHHSFDKVAEMLKAFGLKISRVQENRIDYAFHTNVVQKPMEYFNDQFLSEHLDTTFCDAWKHLKVTSKRNEFFDLDYFALGNRKSNSLYFRVYNKTKEVVEMNYKSFFFEIWRKRGLISKYDEYVLNVAYAQKSYKVGVNVGRIDWYLEYGKDAELKAKLRKLRETCNIKSDNNPRMEREIAGVLPPITTVVNFEFETKRKFYATIGSAFDNMYRIRLDGERPELRRLYLLLELRRPIIDVLMKERIVFREDNMDPGSPALDFWKRIRRAKIVDEPNMILTQLRWEYTRNLDGKRALNRLCSSLAYVSMLENNSVDPSSFSEDMWAAATLLNDNDKWTGKKIPKDVFDGVSSARYDDIRTKKARQIKSLIKKRAAKNE